MNTLIISTCLVAIFLIFKIVLNIKFTFMKSKIFLKLFFVYMMTTIVLWWGTEIFAKLLNFNQKLGDSLFLKVYSPYKIIYWTIEYRNKFPNSLNKALELPFYSLILISILIFIRLLRKDAQENVNGSARWIKPLELKRLGYLFKKHKVDNGVILGRMQTFYGDKTIVDNDSTHISVIAPTRSGKGVGVIVPTLLTWKSSTVVLDPKGENYALTAGYRKEKMKQKVLKFAPFSIENSVSYNPLSRIRKGTKYELKDVEVITSILVDDGKSGELDHWASSAKLLLNGAILHVLYMIEERIASLGDVIDFLTDPSNPIDEALDDILKNPEKYNHGLEKEFIEVYGKTMCVGVPKGIHPVVARMAGEMLGKADKERSGVVSSATVKLNLFKDPIIRKNTTRCDFEIMDLMNHDIPVNLYIVIQPEDIALLSPFIRLIVTQIIGTLCPEMKKITRNQVHKHKMLLMFDEFPAFGKIPILEEALAYIAGYGMKAVLIGQSLNQFKKKYGRESSVLDNCATAVFYTPSPNDNETPKIITNLLGKKTVKVRNKSRKMGEILGGSSSDSLQGRDLLTEEEVRNKLGERRNIISLAGKYPIMGWKIRFYEEDYFLKKTIEYTIPLTDFIKNRDKEVTIEKGEEN